MNFVSAEISRYLETGDYDNQASAWPESDVLARLRAQGNDFHAALMGEVKSRSSSVTAPILPNDSELFLSTRKRLEPMVGGLFPAVERERMLEILVQAVVFLTPENVESHLKKASSWPTTAWRLANIYLEGLGVATLDNGLEPIVGYSEGDKFYLSPKYFTQPGRFADFLVHEAAHIFHNWKREYAGLPFTRYNEWLVPIDFSKRETFAYACEIYSCIRAHGAGPRQRLALVGEYAAENHVGDERVNQEELVDILREAAAARNGWKRILLRCKQPKRLALKEQVSRYLKTCERSLLNN